VTWVLVRAFFMHLQIVWDWLQGKISYLVANAVALIVTIILTARMLHNSDVSFRFGGYCHVNVGSLASYWGWLLGFCGLACILQLATFAYCIKIYLTTSFNAKKADSSHGAGSLTESSRSRAARATARRVFEALSLQWRSLMIVAVAILTTTMVCIVFVVYDKNNLTVEAFANTDDVVPWIICVITQDKEQCLQYTWPIILPEALSVATLFVLAFVGLRLSCYFVGGIC
jgi:hypothetical protein